MSEGINPVVISKASFGGPNPPESIGCLVFEVS